MENLRRGHASRLAEAWKNPPGAAYAERSIVEGGPRSMVVERIGKTDPRRAAAIKAQAASENWKHGAA
jgi:hypothetical protein